MGEVYASTVEDEISRKGRDENPCLLAEGGIEKKIVVSFNVYDPDSTEVECLHCLENGTVLVLGDQIFPNPEFKEITEDEKMIENGFPLREV